MGVSVEGMQWVGGASRGHLLDCDRAEDVPCASLSLPPEGSSGDTLADGEDVEDGDSWSPGGCRCRLLLRVCDLPCSKPLFLVLILQGVKLGFPDQAIERNRE